MKKTTFCLLTAFIFLFLTSSQFKTEIENKSNTISSGTFNEIETDDVNASIVPMKNIDAMGLSTMSQSEINQFNSGHANYKINQQYNENLPVADGGGLIVIIMLVFLY